MPSRYALVIFYFDLAISEFLSTIQTQCPYIHDGDKIKQYLVIMLCSHLEFELAIRLFRSLDVELGLLSHALIQHFLCDSQHHSFILLQLQRSQWFDLDLNREMIKLLVR